MKPIDWKHPVLRLLRGTFFVLLALLAALVGLNVHNPELKPETQAWLAAPEPELAPERNGYYAWWALRSSETDPFKAGQALLAAPSNAEQALALALKPLLPSKFTLPSCKEADASCLAAIQSQAEALRGLSQTLAGPLANYRAMVATERFQPVALPTAFNTGLSSPHSTPHQLAKLSRSLEVLAALEGDRESLLRLRSDLRFWQDVHRTGNFFEIALSRASLKELHILVQALQQDSTLAKAVGEVMAEPLLAFASQDPVALKAMVLKAELRTAESLLRAYNSTEMKVLGLNLGLKPNDLLNLLQANYELVAQGQNEESSACQFPWRLGYNLMTTAVVCIADTAEVDERYLKPHAQVLDEARSLGLALQGNKPELRVASLP